MQPEIVTFMVLMVFITIKIGVMSIEHWRERDKEEE